MIGTSQFLKEFGMDDCTDLSLKMLGKSIKSIPLLIKGILIILGPHKSSFKGSNLV